MKRLEVMVHPMLITLCVLWDVPARCTATHEPNDDGLLQLSGKITRVSPGRLEIAGNRFLLPENCCIYSQAHRRISFAELLPGRLARIAYRFQDGNYVLRQIKLLDSDAQHRFRGKIVAIDDDQIWLDGRIFRLDQFSRRIGERLHLPVSAWDGLEVTVTAIANDVGEWIVEVIQESDLGCS